MDKIFQDTDLIECTIVTPERHECTVTHLDTKVDKMIQTKVEGVDKFSLHITEVSYFRKGKDITFNFPLLNPITFCKWLERDRELYCWQTRL